nr:hypothetical protein B0A51_14529 [Rachicladosporium sp. CCFEE 5018]
MAARKEMQDTSKTIATEMDESITTLRSSTSSWDLPSHIYDSIVTPSTSSSGSSPRVALTCAEPELAVRVKMLEAAILKLSLRLSSLEDSHSGECGTPQSTADQRGYGRNINAKRPQRQHSEEFFEAARMSSSRLSTANVSCRTEPSLPQHPAEEPDIFTSLIRSINATQPQRQDSEDFFDAARSSLSGTSRKPRTWDYLGVSTALARASAASRPQRQDSEDSFEAVRKRSLSTGRRPGSWDPQRRDAVTAPKAIDDAEKGECWPEWADDDFMTGDGHEECRKPSTMAQFAGPDWTFWRPQHLDSKSAESAAGGERNPFNGPKSFRHQYIDRGRALVVDDVDSPALPTDRSEQSTGMAEPWTSIPGLGMLPLPPTTAAPVTFIREPAMRARTATRPLSPLAEKDRSVDLMKGWWTEP